MDSQTNGTDDRQRYKRAKAHVDALRGFYVHLLTYLLVNAGLFLLNLITRDGGGWWFYWPLFGWGIGLAAHGISTLTEFGPFGHRWEEKKIKEFMEKDKHEPGSP